MGKFCDNIGFINTIETEPGLWEENIIEKKYYGDVTRNINKFQNSDNVNNDIIISNIISIVADPYANKNFSYMKYVNYMGTKWKIESAEIQYPRIILTLGGVYHEQKN